MSSSESAFRIYDAPLQGFTEAPWRRAQHFMFGGADAYFTPFVRMEKGEPRRRDIRDIISPLNDGVPVVPQIIFRDFEEFTALVEAVASAGYTRIDMNMGCPFPPQVSRGRGAGTLLNLVLLEKTGIWIAEHPELSFSVKMRLGVDEANQWKPVAPVLSSMPLHHVALHPRTARQQYKGDLILDEVEAFIDAVGHPVIFNGELKSLEDVAQIRRRFPELAGVMLGRGLLTNPLLAAQIRAEECDGQHAAGPEISAWQAVCRLYGELHAYYSSVLCGDTQILSKLKPYFEYWEPIVSEALSEAGIPRRVLKKFLKQSSLPPTLTSLISGM